MSSNKEIKKIFNSPTKRDEIRFKTGSDLIDLVVGGGEGKGYPGGRIINLVGDKSSGKTFIACEIIASAYHKYKDNFKWVYDDSESGFTFNTKNLYGFEIMPIEKKDRTRSKTVEDLYGNCRKFFESLKSDEFGIYVVDSLDGLTSTEMEKRGDKRFNAFKQGKEFKEGSYQMQKAKFLSQEFFPPMADLIEIKNGLLIVISQTRDKIDAMFKSQTRAGGKAMDFYCHTVLWLSTFYKIKKKDRPIGTVVKAHAKKSKTPRPFRSCTFILLFDYGLDNIGSNLDYLFDLRGENGLLKKNAQSIVWKEGIEEPTIKNLVNWIKEVKIETEYKTKFGKTTLRGDDKKEVIIEWLSEDYPEKFLSKFGVSRSRADLIDWIEENELEEELSKRVEDKWENIEKEIKTKRKKKYS